MKPSIDRGKPLKPQHVKYNFKKELKTLGKKSFLNCFRKEQWDSVLKQNFVKENAENRS